MTNSKPWLPLAAALVSVCLWSAAFVGIRAAGRAFSPGALALGRLTMGSLLLGAVVLARGWIKPTRRELAAVFLKERFTRNVLIGGAVAFSGVLLIGFATSTGTATLTGVVLCLAVAVASAIGLVAQKPVLGRLSALQVTWTCCAVGALVCLPYAPVLARELRSAPTTAITWLVFLGVLPTSVAFTTWAYALARGTAGRVVAIAYLVPPVTIAMSWLILGEVPGLVAVTGGALCFAGVYITRRP